MVPSPAACPASSCSSRLRIAASSPRSRSSNSPISRATWERHTCPRPMTLIAARNSRHTCVYARRTRGTRRGRPAPEEPRSSQDAGAGPRGRGAAVHVEPGGYPLAGEDAGTVTHAISQAIDQIDGWAFRDGWRILPFETEFGTARREHRRPVARRSLGARSPVGSVVLAFAPPLAACRHGRIAQRTGVTNSSLRRSGRWCRCGKAAAAQA